MVIVSSKNIDVRNCYVSKKSGPLAYLKNASSDISFIDNKIKSNEIYKTDGSVNKSDVIVK
jgi:hypothetical protein